MFCKSHGARGLWRLQRTHWGFMTPRFHSHSQWRTVQYGENSNTFGKQLEKSDLSQRDNFFRTERLLLREMKEHKKQRGSLCDFDKSLINNYMDKLVQLDNLDQLMLFLNKIEHFDPSFASLFNCTAINGYSMKGDGQMVKRILQQIFERRLGNISIWNSFISHKARNKEPVNPAEILSTLEKNGVAPDICTFNILASTLVAQGNMDDAELVIRWVKQRGMNCDVISFNTLLRGYCNTNRVELVKEIIEQRMPQENVQPDRYTLATVLNLYSQHGMQKEICSLIFNPEIIRHLETKTCNVVLTALLNTGEVESAVKFFKNMDKFKIGTDSVTISIISNYYVVNGELKEAEKLFQSLQNENYLKTDTNLNNVYLKFLCGMNRIADAEHHFNHTMHPNKLYDNMSISTLMNMFLQNKKFDKCEAYFYSIKPNEITCNLMVNMYAEQHRPVEAAQFLTTMQNDHGIVPSIHTYNTVIKAYTKAKMMEDALQVFHSLPQKHISPDITTLNTIMNAYVKNKGAELAVRMFEEDLPTMYAHVKPDRFTYNTILYAYSRLKQVDKAESLLKYMQEKNNIGIDSYTCYVLLRLYSNVGKSEMGLQLVKQLLHKHKIFPHEQLVSMMKSVQVTTDGIN